MDSSLIFPLVQRQRVSVQYGRRAPALLSQPVHPVQPPQVRRLFSFLSSDEEDGDTDASNRNLQPQAPSPQPSLFDFPDDTLDDAADELQTVKPSSRYRSSRTAAAPPFLTDALAKVAQPVRHGPSQIKYQRARRQPQTDDAPRPRENSAQKTAAKEPLAKEPPISVPLPKPEESPVAELPTEQRQPALKRTSARRSSPSRNSRPKRSKSSAAKEHKDASAERTKSRPQRSSARSSVDTPSAQMPISDANNTQPSDPDTLRLPEAIPPQLDSTPYDAVSLPAEVSMANIVVQQHDHAESDSVEPPHVGAKSTEPEGPEEPVPPILVLSPPPPARSSNRTLQQASALAAVSKSRIANMKHSGAKRGPSFDDEILRNSKVVKVDLDQLIPETPADPMALSLSAVAEASSLDSDIAAHDTSSLPVSLDSAVSYSHNPPSVLSRPSSWPAPKGHGRGHAVTYGRVRSFKDSLESLLCPEHKTLAQYQQEQSLDESDDEQDKGVVKMHQLRHAGKWKAFKDELDYIFDGLCRTRAVSVRRISYIDLCKKLASDEFFQFIKVHDMAPKVFAAMVDEPSQEPIIMSCIVFILWMWLRDRRLSSFLVAQEPFDSIICRALSVSKDPFRAAPSNRIEKKLMDAVRQIVDQSPFQSEAGCKPGLHAMCFCIISHLLEAHRLLDSNRFKVEIRDNESALRSLADLWISWSPLDDHSLPNLSRSTNFMRLIEYLTLRVRRHGLVLAEVDGFVAACARLCRISWVADLGGCLLATLCALLNLSHDNEVAARALSEPDCLRVVFDILTISCGTDTPDSLSQDDSAPNGTLDMAPGPASFDAMIAAAGLAVNILVYNPGAHKSLEHTDPPSQQRKQKQCRERCSSSKPILHKLLQTYLLRQRWETTWEEESLQDQVGPRDASQDPVLMAQAENTVLCGYTALVLGLLCQHSEDNRQLVKTRLGRLDGLVAKLTDFVRISRQMIQAAATVPSPSATDGGSVEYSLVERVEAIIGVLQEDSRP
ncbi:uncharacterized protein BJ171DRAFT_514626 [Polychytrium aggregatum]|uniref:uncharacterized protein n=1 Tax=Polychytrium aggregatum TaxID=110093 RepID=UPI0022FEC3C3|nr:uncharacterized protein BJ171DRAFT_514626 [Polychytrium aggregatum]KAI9202269.1 hypothetical protein BJ171DRAFT_514626 [Polychytrium aggregatum]